MVLSRRLAPRGHYEASTSGRAELTQGSHGRSTPPPPASPGHQPGVGALLLGRFGKVERCSEQSLGPRPWCHHHAEEDRVYPGRLDSLHHLPLLLTMSSLNILELFVIIKASVFIVEILDNTRAYTEGVNPPPVHSLAQRLSTTCWERTVHRGPSAPPTSAQAAGQPLPVIRPASLRCFLNISKSTSSYCEH